MSIISGIKNIDFVLWYHWVRAPLLQEVRKLWPYGALAHNTLRKKVLALAPEPPESALDGLHAENYRVFSHEGFRLWEIAKSSLGDAVRHPNPDWETHQAEIRSFFLKAVRYLQAFQQFFAGRKTQAIVVEQGYQIDMRAAVEAARRIGLQTIAAEHSFIKDLFFLDDTCGGICNRHSLSRNSWDRIRARALSDAERQRVAAFMRSYATMIGQKDSDDTQELRRRITGGRDKSIVLLLGQVRTDASLIMDSPVYPDQVDFIRDVAEAMRPYGASHQLVVRLHPKESWGTTHNKVPFDNPTLRELEKFEVLSEPHVTLFHSLEVNTYSLMDLCDCAVTLNSQSGLEVLARHKPVLTAANAYYAGKGFTLEATSRRVLGILLQQLVSKYKLTEEQKHDIDLFLYHLIFEYLFPADLQGCRARLRELFRV